jgi:hypothetical protein
MLRAVLVLFAVASLPASALAQCDDDVCPDGVDAGPPDRPDDCWSDDVGGDICNPNPPEPCVPGEPNFTFTDNLDSNPDDDQVYAVNSDAGKQACGTLTVAVTGYYRIFDAELAESGPSQQDETGYVTITNSCNAAGWPAERNYEDRFLIVDVDNESCSGETCGPGRSCGPAGGCIPDDPTFMGTFLLVAGEDNTICLNHWCPEYDAIVAAGGDPGFEFNNCAAPGAINSIHFRVTEQALACEDTTTLYPCTFGCFEGTCADDPCESADCPLYCKDGTCYDSDPCEGLDCVYGCKNGYCLQGPDSRGNDGDGDGYNELGDCNDEDATVNPGAEEVCGNGVDDDCDGTIDEDDCGSGSGADDSKTSGGCACDAATSGSQGLLLALLLALGCALLLGRRRQPLRQRRRRR